MSKRLSGASIWMRVRKCKHCSAFCRQPQTGRHEMITEECPTARKCGVCFRLGQRHVRLLAVPLPSWENLAK